MVKKEGQIYPNPVFHLFKFRWDFLQYNANNLVDKNATNNNKIDWGVRDRRIKKKITVIERSINYLVADIYFESLHCN